MKHLMKSHLYQMRKQFVFYAILIAPIILEITMFMGEYNYNEEKISAGLYFAQSFLPYLVAMIFPVGLTGVICAMDFVDKTSNYELMSGHTRKDTYFSKAILCLIVGVLGYILVYGAFSAYAISMAGFGNEITMKEFMTRTIISVFPVMRMICEFVCVAFLVRNPYINIAGGIGVCFFGEVIPAMVSNHESYFLGITNLFRLSNYESWMTYTLNDTVNMIYVYGRTITTGEIVSTIVSSIAFGIAFLWLGYSFYKRDDLR